MMGLISACLGMYTTALLVGSSSFMAITKASRVKGSRNNTNDASWRYGITQHANVIYNDPCYADTIEGIHFVEARTAEFHPISGEIDCTKACSVGSNYHIKYYPVTHSDQVSYEALSRVLADKNGDKNADKRNYIQYAALEQRTYTVDSLKCRGRLYFAPRYHFIGGSVQKTDYCNGNSTHHDAFVARIPYTNDDVHIDGIYAFKCTDENHYTDLDSIAYSSL
ncbi:hypothetical protein AX774_g2836 [Zancudomyces culisetae]|uniref:Uncharacterized protein n=1 Tax=Zancudomyces culisetae TaxID=1213189 RepID=A0A1R1PRY7_ZANCU|nr:hypothetical protein AX774_g2836 [Zancudomyces culisetae]|eukprot:OMH83653.1 hypothetical protein AX774_g2836 [Zancudomyces culisetae]